MISVKDFVIFSSPEELLKRNVMINQALLHDVGSKDKQL
jgi:hypothetical protein